MIRKPIRGAAALLVLVFAAPACALFGEPNRRELVWEGARAEMLLARPEQRYSRVWITFKDRERDWTVRMPDGRWLKTAGLESSVVERYTPPVLVQSSASGKSRVVVLFDRGECATWLGYIGGSIVFEFETDRLVGLELSSNVSRPEHCRPGLGDGDGEPARSMPLTEDELVELFGPYLRKREYFSGL